MEGQFRQCIIEYFSVKGYKTTVIVLRQTPLKLSLGPHAFCQPAKVDLKLTCTFLGMTVENVSAGIASLNPLL